MTKFNIDRKTKENYENAQLLRKRRIKMEKNKIKRKLKRENDILYNIKNNTINTGNLLTPTN